MHSHTNARLTQRGRHRLVIFDTWSRATAARSLLQRADTASQSLRQQPPLAYRWLDRYRSGAVRPLNQIVVGQQQRLQHLGAVAVAVLAAEGVLPLIWLLVEPA